MLKSATYKPQFILCSSSTWHKSSMC